MRRSIRWSLHASYAVALLIVLSLLGGMLVRQRRESTEDALKTELEAHGLAIAGAIEWDEEDGFELELDPTYLERFRQTDADAPYFEVRAANGSTLYSPTTGREPRPPAMLQLAGPKQVVRVAGPNATTVWVRQGTQALQGELAQFGKEVFLSCLLGFVAAMLGSLVLVQRVLAPIRRISDTASRISASNPEERIDVGQMERELGSLATTLNGAFDRLQGAVDQQVRFTADASHDLRTPLAVLKANIEWALRGERQPEEIRDTLAACMRATDRMNHTVEDLLALARSDAEDPPTRQGSVNLQVLVGDTAEFVQPIADAGQVRIETACEPAEITGDAARLREAATALVTNALQHVPAGGRVMVRTGVEGERAFVEVADTGPGISDADLQHVFERFYRADASRRGGNGLGLAIAKQIVEAHDGTIEARNREAGGAVFTLRIPTG